MTKKSFLIQEPLDLRLDVYITKKLDQTSRSIIKHHIIENDILVNGKSSKPSYLLQKGDLVEVSFEEVKNNDELVPQRMNLEILYEDKNIAAINKPSGIVMHPGVGNKSGTLANGLVHHFNNLSDINGKDRLGIVHRLDADTSGIVLIAKTNESHINLSNQFKNRSINKVYFAITWGKWPNKVGAIEGYMNRKKTDPTSYSLNTSKENGKYSKSFFQINKQYSNFACVEFRPLTGRTHQIRVHSSSNGNPIFGDNKYGGGLKKCNEYSSKFKKLISKEIINLNRHALHAHSVDFELLNSNGKRLKLEAPIPTGLRKLENKLSSYEK
ncbi:RluA family pseudouridine synthase [bacterium]|nr:RluA family pseudouridine synthase [bacterium]